MKFSVLFLMACAAFAFAQETVESVRRETKAVEAQTVREKDLTAQEAKRHAAFVENSKAKAASLGTQEKALKAQIDSLRAETASLKSAKQKAEGTAKWYTNRKTRYGEQLAQILDSLAPSLEADFPYKNAEAATAIRETASKLRKGLSTPEDAIAAVCEILLDRIRLGYTTETWSGYLPVEGRSVAGKFLRFGAVASVFVGQSGDEVYWLAQDSTGYAWLSAGDNLELRASLKDALKVAEGKSVPRLVEVPISKPVQSSN
jgi:hypothetical protein